MASRILVTGGTGTLGRHVVRRLRDAGRDVRVLSLGIHEAENGIEPAKLACGSPARRSTCSKPDDSSRGLDRPARFQGFSEI
jgi:nucleoside-diphosphate-sugar epimerase